MKAIAILAAALLGTVLVPGAVEAQGRGGGRGGAPPDTTGQGGAPSLAALIAEAGRDSDLRVAMRRFNEDLSVLRQRYDFPRSPVRIERERVFHQGWLAALERLDAGELNEAGRADHAALRQRILAGLAELEAQERQLAEMAPLVPFARPLQRLQERRRERLDVEPRQAAQTLEDARKDVLRLTAALEGAAPGAPGGGGLPEELRGVTPAVAGQTLSFLNQLRQPLASWYTYYDGFDPLFNWWVRMPYQELLEALEAYEAALRLLAPQR